MADNTGKNSAKEQRFLVQVLSINDIYLKREDGE